MLILGLILALIGFFTGIQILLIIGVILLIVGAVLFFVGRSGTSVGGRRYWY